MQKKMMKFEIGGIFFVLVFSVFLQNLYELSNHTLIGVMFGSVNDSIWETVKTILLTYLIWGMIELLCIHPPLHKFAPIKIFTMYLMGASYILLSLAYSLSGSPEHTLPEYFIAILCISFSAFLSYRLVLSDKKFKNLFAPSFFMLLLFIALFCSFTPFPPQNYVFMDRTTQFYGLIPRHIDAGGIALDTLYSL